MAFNETDFSQIDKKFIHNLDVDVCLQEEANASEVEQQQHPQRQSKPPVRYRQHECHIACNVYQIQEPKSLEEALATEHANQ